jgi:photosystem II stability/assembly factor-like uncharacterized protein
MRGWITGERGIILFTQDAGFTWVESDSITDVSLYGLSFPDAENGWVVGDHGTIVKLTLPIP